MGRRKRNLDAAVYAWLDKIEELARRIPVGDYQSMMMIQRADVIRLCEIARQERMSNPGRLLATPLPALLDRLRPAIREAIDPANKEPRVAAPAKPAKPRSDKAPYLRCLWRVCEFCKAKTNRNVRACCIQGRDADIAAGKSAGRYVRKNDQPGMIGVDLASKPDETAIVTMKDGQVVEAEIISTNDKETT